MFSTIGTVGRVVQEDCKSERSEHTIAMQRNTIRLL